MEAGGGATRLTRRAASEARSHGKATTFENPTTSNPFTALVGQAGQTDDSDGDSEDDLTEGEVAFQAAPGAKRRAWPAPRGRREADGEQVVPLDALAVAMRRVVVRPVDAPQDAMEDEPVEHVRRHLHDDEGGDDEKTEAKHGTETARTP